MSETAICEITTSVEIEFDIECGRCGCLLTANFKEAKKYALPTFKIDPCENCETFAVEAYKENEKLRVELEKQEAQP